MISTITIVGGGPAGSSLAIRLAEAGFVVTLVEKDAFPRQKLCGEFISPECFAHFDALGVSGRMFERGGDRIAETIFYGRSGRSVSIPSEWFGSSGALSLSRAEMDLILLERAKDAGVTVYGSTRIVDLILKKDIVIGINIRDKDGSISELRSDILIDATGRAAVVRRMLDKRNDRQKAVKPTLLGFKTHLTSVELERGRCEIYSFEGGYGGLSFVEDGFANFCFLIKADTAKKFGGKAQPILDGAILRNRRAAETLENAAPVYDWLAVAVDRFGKKDLAPAPNVLTVGDAAAFIDPFTGSGMLLALESAEVLAQCISECRSKPLAIPDVYNNWFDQKFLARLRVSSILRNAAYFPMFAGAAIEILGSSRRVSEFVTRTTRHGWPISPSRR